MRIIKLFLASSVVEFEHDRRELGDYIRSLNDIYIKRDIYFELTICEDLSNAIARDRKQEEYNQNIRECEYFYVLFGREAGAYTIEEFDVALQQFRESGAPHIYTYFRQLPEGQSAAKSVTDFMERLDKEIGHYYSTYSHLDSVKLNLLLELTRNPEVNSKLKFENGKALVDETPLLSLEHVPVYSKNDALQKCIAQRQRLDEELIRLRAAMLEHPEDDSLFDQRMTVSQQRNQLAEQIRQMEADILNLCSAIAERSSSGRPMTWREKQASRMLDAGDYEGALALLNDEQRQKELAQAEAIAENGLDRIRGYISENLLKIQTLKSRGITKETVPEITACYEECVRLAEKHHVELEALYEYADFLYCQRRYPQAIKIAERLRIYYELEQVEEEKWAELYNLLGISYAENNNHLQAELNYERALKIRRRLAGENPEAYEPDLAGSCNNLSVLYKDTNRFPEAEALQQEALEIYRRLAEKNPEAYEPELANSCNNLAILYKDTNRFLEAEALYHEALEIFRKLAENSLKACEPDLASSCNNLAILLSDANRIPEAEALYQEALEIYRRLAEKNPEAYEPELADSCNNLAILLFDTNRIPVAETLFQEALEIRRRLAGRNPEAYEQKLAGSCNNLAVLYKNTNRFPEAEALHQEALEIRRRLAEKNPEAYEPDLAGSCNNLAILYKNTNHIPEAEVLHQEALEIRRRLAEANPDAYEPAVAKTCYNLALLKWKGHDLTAAKELFEESLTIAEKYPRLSKQSEDIRRILSYSMFQPSSEQAEDDEPDESPKLSWIDKLFGLFH